MKRSWLAIGFLLFALCAALGAQGDEAYPGQRDHKQPPNGWYCVPTDTAKRMQTDAHACNCLGMTSDPMCPEPAKAPAADDGEPARAPNDNPKCRVYCWKDRCTCMRLCEDTKNGHSGHVHAN